MISLPWRFYGGSKEKWKRRSSRITAEVVVEEIVSKWSYITDVSSESDKFVAVSSPENMSF
jgi:hypothetical protein